MISIEELNKTQLILLTLLICFVTSIATGIITTSLLAEAPPEVTQTINRVVERTVEKVVPTSGSPKEVTLRAEDQKLLANVGLAASMVVTIVDSATSTTEYSGVIVSKDGLVVSGSTNFSPEGTYFAILSDNSKLPLRLATTSPAEHMTIFKIVSPTPETAE